MREEKAPMSGAMRLVMVKESGRMVQRTVWQEDSPIEGVDGPRARHQEQGSNPLRFTRITLPRVKALDHVVVEERREIRFAPKSAPVNQVKLRNLATIRRVGRMLQRSGGA
jgi:hypothetical protein